MNETAKMSNIAVIGAGTMGHGIAQVFAVAGYEVRLYDPKAGALEEALHNITKSLRIMAGKELISRDEVYKALERIDTGSDLEAACRNAGLVMEAAPEILELKQELLARVQKAAGGEAVICTNTSALPLGLVGRKLARPEMLVGTHFWNPPQVVPCVEVIRGEKTSPEVFDRAYEILLAAGKEPVRVNRDIPGFLGNRMQHALQREALYLVEKGIASPEDVDKVVKYGFGMRYAVMGPLERADLGGLDTTMRVQETVLPELDSRKEPSPLLKGKVKDGDLGIKSGKGFFIWDGEKAHEATAKRDETLLDIICLTNKNRRDG